MTLEEAVEIVSWGLLPYGRICWQEEFNKRPHSAENAKRAESAAFDRFVRARAIVDQAARYVQSCRELEAVGDTGSEPIAKRVADEWVKLRAMERGEEISKEKA
jgi:hypothetical protein